MAWKYDKPLYSLATEDQNDHAKHVWENESLGGIMEDNHKLPQAVVWLLVLTVITAFLVTAPLWGQRPKAAIYEEYIALMDTPQVVALEGDEKKMEYIVNTVRSEGSKWAGDQDRHPLTMNDLRLIKDQIVELQRENVDMDYYTVIGKDVALANFEGEVRPDGVKKRVQPSWDKGYTIDVFYVIYFCLAVMITVKRLPPSDWEPDHSVGH
ncbi:MAG: hypothetical protein COC05_03220 [Gammaproteobacteria bacterium]|nr:MAG: hypothetical protein COC05_03220 [Gammaproteobacteria bacterium]